MGNSYFLYKKQVKYSGGTWEDVTPQELSINGAGTMPLAIYRENDPECTITPIYKWENMNPTTDYWCDDCYTTEYLTIESEENANQVFFQGTSLANLIISASTNGGSSWTQYTSTTSGVMIAQLNEGEKVLIKGLNQTYEEGHIQTNGRFKLYGNIMSLLYGDNFASVTALSSANDLAFYQFFKNCTGLTSAEDLVLPATTLSETCYAEMFMGCTNLTSAPRLPAATMTYACYAQMFRGCANLLIPPQLPATILANSCYSYMFADCTRLMYAPALQATSMAENCYQGMFRNCYNLTTAPALQSTMLASGCYSGMFENCYRLTASPALPATTLAVNCYGSMFNGCSRLMSAPALSATTLTQNCYNAMFQNCSALRVAPVLPASTLAQGCYQDMFNGCINLAYIKCMATNLSATDCTTDWVADVAESGSFVKAIAMTSWTNGVNGIPIGWTVQSA